MKNGNGVMTEQSSSPGNHVRLEVSKDAMRAMMTILSTEDFIDEREMLAAIEQAGVTEGFERAAEFLRESGEERLPGEPFPLALGTPAAEAGVEFTPLFDAAAAWNPATVGEDLHQLHRCPCVKAGEPLAYFFVTRPPKTGRDVRGNELHPQLSAEETVNARLGQGAAYDADRSQVVATVNGYPWMDAEGRVGVKSDFTVDGDLGLDYDHFAISGNLTVNGTMRDKLVVEITGNLVVNGDIDDATVHVDGNVTVRGDILNCRAGGVHGTGDITFRSADNALVVCAGRISFSDHAQFCKLIAGRGVYGDQDRSALVGGLVQSGEHVEVAVIGSAGAIGTEVEITISPYIKEKMLALSKKLSSLRDRPEENAALIKKLSETLQDYENQLEEQINRTLLGETGAPRHIVAFRKVFAGAYIRILKKSLTVVDEMDKVSFSILDGELVTDSYKTD